MTAHDRADVTRSAQRLLEALQDLALAIVALDAAAGGRGGLADTAAHTAAHHRRQPPGSRPPTTLVPSDTLAELRRDIPRLLRRSRASLGWDDHVYDLSAHTGARCPYCQRLHLRANLTERTVYCGNRICRATPDDTAPPVWALDDELTPGVFGLTPAQLDPDSHPQHDDQDGLPFNVEDAPLLTPAPTSHTTQERP